jgi:hypothetical protein
MALSKQGMLICHAIALTLILMSVAAWKLPSSPDNLPTIRLQEKVSVQPFYTSSVLLAA